MIHRREIIVGIFGKKKNGVLLDVKKLMYELLNFGILMVMVILFCSLVTSKRRALPVHEHSEYVLFIERCSSKN